jgi:hypothetical protein
MMMIMRSLSVRSVCVFVFVYRAKERERERKRVEFLANGFWVKIEDNNTLEGKNFLLEAQRLRARAWHAYLYFLDVY